MLAGVRLAFVLPFALALRFSLPLYYALMAAMILAVALGHWQVAIAFAFFAAIVSSLDLGAALERAGRRRSS